MNSPDNPSAKADEFLDLKPCFRPVAQKYGRPMFTLVMSAGMASQAAQVLAAQAQKRSSSAIAHAAGVLATSFNAVSNAYVKEMEWDEATIVQCDRDIQLAFAGRIATPGSAILLNS